MMKQIMKRAWEIYRTLTGDKAAKLSMALRMAWIEAKSAIELGKSAYGCGFENMDKAAYVARRFEINRKARERKAIILAIAETLLPEFEGMEDYEADSYAWKKAKELVKIKTEENYLKANAYKKAAKIYTGDAERRAPMLGIYDTVGHNYGILEA